ncbi:hypothetical protein Ocin01_05838 [Orchesella cincta]|uniref:Uncharacterized protein n=1 Tax=Orchesella cincta TaxID=48709 RepID=A0A1D2N6F1_ORCCI|nr:hypothetical protein Ocin01_05838 [Orchesella cincta]
MMSIPNFKLILCWIRGINVFLGFSSLIIIWNLYTISNYLTKKEHINPKDYWHWESQLGAGNLSRVVIQRPKSVLSGYQFCEETQSFYNTLREKRTELYLTPGIEMKTGERVCPNPNLEVASLTIATCCFLYCIFIVFVGESRSDVHVFGNCLFEIFFGLLLLSSSLMYYFYTDLLVDICYMNHKYAEQAMPAFKEYLQTKNIFVSESDGQIRLEYSSQSQAATNSTYYIPPVHKCKHEFKVLWRYCATLLAGLNAIGLFVSAVVSATHNSMRRAVDNALQEAVIDDAGVTSKEKATKSLDHANPFDHKQDDQTIGSSHSAITFGSVDSSVCCTRFSETTDISEGVSEDIPESVAEDASESFSEDVRQSFSDVSQSDVASVDISIVESINVFNSNNNNNDDEFSWLQV